MSDKPKRATPAFVRAFDSRGFDVYLYGDVLDAAWDIAYAAGQRSAAQEIERLMDEWRKRVERLQANELVHLEQLSRYEAVVEAARKAPHHGPLADALAALRRQAMTQCCWAIDVRCTNDATREATVRDGNDTLVLHLCQAHYTTLAVAKQLDAEKFGVQGAINPHAGE